MKKMTALVLSLLLLLSLTACGEKTIVGTWKGQVNLTGVMQDLWNKSTEKFPEIRQEMEIGEVPVYITMIFHEDNTCTIDVDDASLEQFFTQTREQMKAVVGAHIDQFMDGETSIGGAFEGLLQGLPEGDFSSLLELPLVSAREMLDLVIDSLSGPLMQKAVLAGIERQGNYLEKDGQLYISNSLSTPAEKDRPSPYTLEGDTLTIQAWTIPTNTGLGELTFPLILERQ